MREEKEVGSKVRAVTESFGEYKILGKWPCLPFHVSPISTIGPAKMVASGSSSSPTQSHNIHMEFIS